MADEIVGEPFEPRSKALRFGNGADSVSGRILLVDEDETTRESLELIASAEGYEVLSVDCAESALETLDATPVEAVLCDIRIPGIDGFDLIPQILRGRPDVYDDIRRYKQRAPERQL